MPSDAYPETVETDRLLLRRWRPDDRAAYVGIRTDPIVWAGLRSSEDEDAAESAKESFDRLLHNWAERRFGAWAALHRDSDEIVGSIGASHPTFVPEVATEIEIGWILQSRYWGRGLATEAARAAVDATFTHLDPPRAISLILPSNARSIAVAKRLGMRPAETVRAPDLGVDLVAYELPRESAGVA